MGGFVTSGIPPYNMCQSCGRNPVQYGNAICNTCELLAQHYAMTMPNTWVYSGKVVPAEVKKPKPLKTDGTVWGELTGWRIWRVNNGFLQSFTQNHIWAPGEPMEGAPSDHGSDGIWSFKRKGDAIRKAIEYGGPYAYGSVKLWGDVIEHTDGYRSQYAKIASIDGITKTHGVPIYINDLRRTYGLPEAEEPKPIKRGVDWFGGVALFAMALSGIITLGAIYVVLYAIWLHL